MEKTIVIYNSDETEMYIHQNTPDFISREIKSHRKFYEHELLDFLRVKFPNQRNIIDIGANIGNHSLFFAKYMNCETVFSFEPFPDNITIFKTNLRDYTEKCILFETALSDKNATRVLYNTGVGNFGGISFNCEPHSYVANPSIECRTLDTFMLNNVSFIKIDVENHENEVLDGARETILRNRPIIILENSYYYFSHLFPDPEPHRGLLELNYKKVYSNIRGSSMDLWIPE